ncbi:MAG: hypothetical protein U0904_07345 [Candidatus Nanopelagicales bacterium]|nr:hypothetical protein [Candidatus Nanopelagicales bacterium]
MIPVLTVLAAVIGCGSGLAAAYCRRHRNWYGLVTVALFYLGTVVFLFVRDSPQAAWTGLVVGFVASLVAADVRIPPRVEGRDETPKRKGA